MNKVSEAINTVSESKAYNNEPVLCIDNYSEKQLVGYVLIHMQSDVC